MVANDYHFFSLWGTPYTKAYFTSNQEALEMLTWGENSISWYNEQSSSKQLNDSGHAYYYVALLAANE